MKGRGLKKEGERVAAFFGMLDKWDRAEGAVSANSSKPSSELLE